MALKVRQTSPPRLALVHGWLFPGLNRGKQRGDDICMAHGDKGMMIMHWPLRTDTVPSSKCCAQFGCLSKESEDLQPPPPPIQELLAKDFCVIQVSNGEPDLTKSCFHCKLQSIHSPGKENQVSLLRTFLVSPRFRKKISPLGGVGKDQKSLHIRSIHGHGDFCIFLIETTCNMPYKLRRFDLLCMDTPFVDTPFGPSRLGSKKDPEIGMSHLGADSAVASLAVQRDILLSLAADMLLPVIPLSFRTNNIGPIKQLEHNGVQELFLRIKGKPQSCEPLWKDSLSKPFRALPPDNK